MKRIHTLVYSTALFLALAACKKDDEDPQPVIINNPPVIVGYSPIANFSVSGGDCGAPCEVVFSNTSANSVAYTWDFGDGSPISDAATSNVTHLYLEPGIYTVTLTAKAANDSTASKVLAVEIKEDAEGNMLMANSYMLTEIDIIFQGQVIDGFDFYPVCQRDDLHKFNQGGEYTVTDAGMQCQPSSASSGTWAFNDDQTKLTLSIQGLTQTYDIVSLSENALVLTVPDSGFGGSATFTYTAQ